MCFTEVTVWNQRLGGTYSTRLFLAPFLLQRVWYLLGREIIRTVCTLKNNIKLLWNAIALRNCNQHCKTYISELEISRVPCDTHVQRLHIVLTHSSFSEWCRQWWELTEVERLAESDMTTGQNREDREGYATKHSVLYGHNSFGSVKLLLCLQCSWAK